jgi:hypothetical protein
LDCGRVRVFFEKLDSEAGLPDRQNDVCSGPQSIDLIVDGDSGIQHPFTMAFGGRLDVNVSKNVAIRPVEIDWLLTRYTNPFTDTNNQNSFRYTAEIVFYLEVKQLGI